MLHITCGHSAGGTLKLHLADGAPEDTVIAFADALSCGPAERTPSNSRDFADWFERRAAYWQRIYGNAPEEPCQLQLTQRVLAASIVTLWLGTGANDQLLLCWLADAMLQSTQRPTLLRIQVEHLMFPRGSAPMPSLGIAHPDQLAQVPAPNPVTQEELTDLANGWQAWCANSPKSLLSYLQSPGSALLARRAISTLLARYPLVGFGVNRWELAILRAVMGTMLDDCLDMVGDGWLYWRARRMANTELNEPLLTLDAHTPVMRGRKVNLTNAGKAVIVGEADAITLNGIHDRVGGVTLSSETHDDWRYNNATLLASSNETA